jgi:hypothetical protein
MDTFNHKLEPIVILFYSENFQKTGAEGYNKNQETSKQGFKV